MYGSQGFSHEMCKGLLLFLVLGNKAILIVGRGRTLITMCLGEDNLSMNWWMVATVTSG